MTSTPVKDVGSVLSSLGAAIGNSAKTSVDVGFQNVLNGQAGKETANSPADKTQTTVKKTPGESLKAKDEHLARMERQKPTGDARSEADEAEEMIHVDRLEEIMALLGMTAADMMQEIADTFGISVEELQSIMQELGMEPLDALDQGKLGELLLKVAGAEDSYALVTDGELYDSYQELMTKLEAMLQEIGEELNMEPAQLEDAIIQLKETEVPEEETIPVEVQTEDRDEVQVHTQRPEQTQQNPAAEMGSQPVAETETVPNAGQETQTQEESGKNREHSDRGDHGSLFAQDARTLFQTQFEPQAQQPQALSEAWSTDTQDIMRQIMDYMRIQVKPDTSNLEMQLHPESLGTLQIHLASRGGMVTANFITQNEAVKAALESQMVQLKEDFEQQGVKVEAIEVTVQSHAFERNLDQGRGQSGAQEQNPKKTRIRRINLNDAPLMESLEEEDALAAEMMAASGSQVDYTA